MATSGQVLSYRVGRLLKTCLYEPRAGEFLKQCSSLAVQRHNTASVLGTLAKESGLNEIFML